MIKQAAWKGMSTASRIATAALLVASLAEAAGKPECRDLTFGGTADWAAGTTVTLRVVDAAGDVVDESCPNLVEPEEGHEMFAVRLVSQWGDGSGQSCGGEGSAATKTCGNGSTGSCSHRFLFKRRKDGTITKDVLRVCCHEGANCKGAGLGRTEPARLPVSVQMRLEPDPEFRPPIPPAVGLSLTPTVFDGIVVTQQPHPELQGCRSALGAAMKPISKLVEGLVACHTDRIKGTVTDVDCNDPEAVATQRGDSSLGEIQARISQATALECSPLGAPADSGYGSCPWPCTGSIDSWTSVAGCAMCAMKTAVAWGMSDAYGSPGPDPGIPQDAVACQDAIGKGFQSLLGSYLGETTTCQKHVDASRKLLPPAVTHCKGADIRRRRAAAEASVERLLDKHCSPEGLAFLATCGTDVPGILDCLQLNAASAAEVVAEAIYPEARFVP